MSSLLYFVLFSKKTAFFKLNDIFPECFLYRKGHPRIDPLICLEQENVCHVGKNCMETLIKRLQVLFKEVIPNCGLVVLYYRTHTGRIRAGIFHSNLGEFRIITVNPYAWNKIKSRGAIFQFHPSSEFFMNGQASDLKETSLESSDIK